MNKSLNFPENIIWEYASINPGDFVSEYNQNWSYRYAHGDNQMIKVILDTSNVTNMRYMFNECRNLIYVSPFNTSNVTDMSYMFGNCNKLTTIPHLDTSNVTNMSYMFYYCQALGSIPHLDTSKVTDMQYMFGNCQVLKSIPHLDTSKVTNMGNMFSNCFELITIPSLDTSMVTNMGSMFSGCTKLTSIPLLDCQKVTYMGSFFGYSNITTITDLGGFKDLGKQNSVSGTSSSFLSYTPKLTHQSLMNVINKLYDRKANGMSTMTLNLGSTNLNKLTDEEKAIAVNKGWNLS